MLADTRLHTQHSTTVQAMREATFLVALVSYMAVVIIALALMVNHLAA
jgi:hypothetical protein